MLKTGCVIEGKYKILSVLGRGGMSVVYLAINEKANKPWAIKEVQKSDERLMDMDRKEIELMKRLRHPNLPCIIDVIEREDSLLIVMDYIEGRSLEDILRESGARPESQVLSWAKQLCGVLAYLHSRTPAVIYRDMKPANVMVKPEGDIMLIDFGAAREHRRGNAKDTVCLGTRGYAAPEQYMEEGQSDVRTDIYCLGAMLFELLTGESPHKLCPIRSLRPELSPGLEAVIQKCTQTEKEDRYQSCGELLTALEHYRELDEGYRSAQRRKLVQFLIPAALTLVFALGAASFGALEIHAQRNSYEAYLFAAANSVSAEERILNYRRAIGLNPAREDAYLLLLKEGLLDDERLSVQESALLREVLIEYGADGMTNESAFRRNEEGYARFAYEAGIAYFYKYDEKEDKKAAKGYFETACASEALDTAKRERAGRLRLIADYYSRIGQADAAGDAYVTYRDYWDDLTELSSGNLVEADNERTALVMYGELLGQILSRAAEFKNAGVGFEEMDFQLENIRARLKEDFKGLSGERKAAAKEELAVMTEELGRAERIVRSVYREEK